MFQRNSIALIILLTLVDKILTLDLCNPTEIDSYPRVTKSQRCGCETNKCIRKCCKLGFYLKGVDCARNGSADVFRVPVYSDKTVVLGVLEISKSVNIGVMECPFYLLNNSDPGDAYYVQENGKLWVYNELIDNDLYCLDDYSDGFRVFLCFPEQLSTAKKVVALGMIISMPFLLLTFLVYAILPESNLHRKALMNYVMTLLLAYIFLVTVQLHNKKFDDVMCPLLGYLIIFFFLVSFFWMNVMCLDMWFAFSGLRGFNGRRIAERKRFLMYSAYAFGVPTLHILIVFLINHYGDTNTFYYPGVGIEKCFLRDKYPNLLYFYGPMAILITINIILFILTAVKIQRVKKETSMLKHSDSRKHNFEDDKQKFNLYVKLLFAMGINWTMEIISWICLWLLDKDVPHYVWYLTDFCNALYGVFIFFIFVFKRKIWKSLKKRYYVLTGRPFFAQTMSVTTHTTRTSNYSTSEAGPADLRLSEYKNARGEERTLTAN